MIQSYSDYKDYLMADLRSQEKCLNPKGFFFDPLVRFTFLLRFNEYLLNSKKPIILRFFWLIWFKRLSIKLGFSIPFNVFDKGVAFVHYGLLIINPRSKIGKNCRIHAGVNIGGAGGFLKKFDSEKIYAPILGDNCYIGPGAKLFGGITIGDNCVIGANSVVNKSFNETGCTIAGVPAKIISDKGSKRFVIEGSDIE
jgi:serine O-acetyltransferase